MSKPTSCSPPSARSSFSPMRHLRSDYTSTRLCRSWTLVKSFGRVLHWLLLERLWNWIKMCLIWTDINVMLISLSVSRSTNRHKGLFFRWWTSRCSMQLSLLSSIFTSLVEFSSARIPSITLWYNSSRMMLWLKLENFWKRALLPSSILSCLPWESLNKLDKNTI